MTKPSPLTNNSTRATRDVTRQLGYRLRVAQASVWRDLVSTFEPFGIKPQQYAAMACLEGMPGMTLDALARALGMQSPNLVAMIDDLARRGMVAKGKRVPDRRFGYLELTATGVAMLAKLKEADDVHERALVSVLGSDQLAQLIDGLTALEVFSSTVRAIGSRKRA